MKRLSSVFHTTSFIASVHCGLHSTARPIWTVFTCIYVLKNMQIKSKWHHTIAQYKEHLETDLSLISQNELHDDWCPNVLMHMCEFMCITRIALETQRSSWRLIIACLTKRARCELSSLNYITSNSSWGPQRLNLLQETSCPCTSTPFPPLGSFRGEIQSRVSYEPDLIKKRIGAPAVAILCIMHPSRSVYVMSECVYWEKSQLS